jgi:hypothetical protein
MCSPSMAAGGSGLGLDVLTEGFSIFEQNKSVEDQADAQIEEANRQFGQSSANLSESQRQQEEQLNAQQREQQRAQAHEQAQATVAFGDRGVTGITPDRLLSNTIMEGSLNIAGTESTRDNVLISSAGNEREIQNQRISSLNNTRNFVTSNFVSPTEAGLRIGGAGLGAVTKGMQLATPFI